MPVYFFVCTSCRSPDRRLLTPEQAAQPLRCRKKMDCRGTLKRNPNPPKAFQKEVVDTGLGNMPRRIERFDDIERINHERAHQDHTKPGWQRSNE